VAIFLACPITRLLLQELEINQDLDTQSLSLVRWLQFLPNTEASDILRLSVMFARFQFMCQEYVRRYICPQNIKKVSSNKFERV
jgi:hypothetical protein